MIRTFGRLIIAVIVIAFYAPIILSAYALFFVCELLSRIVYAESAADELDIKGFNDAVCGLLKETKSYIIG